MWKGKSFLTAAAATASTEATLAAVAAAALKGLAHVKVDGKGGVHWTNSSRCFSSFCGLRFA
jgi:hypothetical protein